MDYGYVMTEDNVIDIVKEMLQTKYIDTYDVRIINSFWKGYNSKKKFTLPTSDDYVLIHTVETLETACENNDFESIKCIITNSSVKPNKKCLLSLCNVNNPDALTFLIENCNMD